MFTLYNEKNRQGENNTLEISIDFSDKAITFCLLKESQPEIYKKKRKMTLLDKQKEWILEVLTSKPVERQAFINTLKQKNKFTSVATFGRAIDELVNSKIKSNNGIYSKI
jgi:hypothetical protein